REEQNARANLERQIAETRKAEASVRESQELYHSLVENIPYTVIRKDRNGVYTFSNSMSEEFLGIRFKNQGMIGRTDFDLFKPELAQKIHDLDQQVMQTGEILEGVFKMELAAEDAPAQNNFYQWVRVPVRNAEGVISGVQVFVWDVTKAKQAEEQLKQAQEYFQSLVENVPVMVIRRDLEGKTTFVNRLGAQFFAERVSDRVGVPAGQLAGKDETEWATPEQLSKIREGDAQVI